MGHYKTRQFMVLSIFMLCQSVLFQMLLWVIITHILALFCTISIVLDVLLDHCNTSSGTALAIVSSNGTDFCGMIKLLLNFPEGRPGMSDVPLLSGISGLSFDSSFLSPLLFFLPYPLALSVLSFFC